MNPNSVSWGYLAIAAITAIIVFILTVTDARAGGMAPPIAPITPIEQVVQPECDFQWQFLCPQDSKQPSQRTSDSSDTPSTPVEPDRPVISAPDAPDEPVTSAPDTPQTGNRPRGDNSDANGKGGNRHDREDFTHGGTEVAEDRKN
jgi:hypothetical protein